MNFLMWFGNTTIMLMAAVMGISMDIFEASDLDGCNSIQRFYYITLPLIRPILAYTLITSIIGGLQMFDVPQILTNGQMCIRDRAAGPAPRYGICWKK